MLSINSEGHLVASALHRVHWCRKFGGNKHKDLRAMSPSKAHNLYTRIVVLLPLQES